MNTATKMIRIDMGHSVTNHKSKCRNIHGHNYDIEVGVEGEVISTPGSSEEGMIIDFGDLKEVIMNKIDGGYDHGFVLWKEDPRVAAFEEWQKQGQKVILVDFIPTAENLAKHWFELIKEPLAERGVKIKHVKVWETPSSTATYAE